VKFVKSVVDSVLMSHEKLAFKEAKLVWQRVLRGQLE
jgi:hypothetical protein